MQVAPCANETQEEQLHTNCPPYVIGSGGKCHCLICWGERAALARVPQQRRNFFSLCIQVIISQIPGLVRGARRTLLSGLFEARDECSARLASLIKCPD